MDFLEEIRKRFNKTQKELATSIEIPLRTWIGWESYKRVLPFNKLIDLSNRLGMVILASL